MRKIVDFFRRPEKVEHIMEDELLGTLTWEEEYRWWRGTMTLGNGKTSKFTIDGKKTDESVSEAVRKLFMFVRENEPLLRSKIAVSMSELYNGQWTSGSDNITADEMAQKINLTDVAFYDEEGGELFYKADDELFADHTICAPLDASGEVGEPDLEG